MSPSGGKEAGGKRGHGPWVGILEAGEVIPQARGQSPAQGFERGPTKLERGRGPGTQPKCKDDSHTHTHVHNTGNKFGTRIYSVVGAQILIPPRSDSESERTINQEGKVGRDTR
jgi:hypothetical protein